MCDLAISDELKSYPLFDNSKRYKCQFTINLNEISVMMSTNQTPKLNDTHLNRSACFSLTTIYDFIAHGRFACKPIKSLFKSFE